jgi:phosphate transport system permease protein
VISFGGILVIVAVMAIFFYLLSVALPLFRGATVETASSGEVEWIEHSGTDPVVAMIDEQKSLALILDRGGRVTTFDPATGRIVLTNRLLPEGEFIRTASGISSDGRVALALESGEVAVASLGFETSFLSGDDLPDSLRDIESGKRVRYRNGVIAKTPPSGYKFANSTAAIDIVGPLARNSSEIHLVDLLNTHRGRTIAVLTKDGNLHRIQLEEKRNLLTNEVTTKTSASTLGAAADPTSLPSHLLLGSGDQLYLVWDDGSLRRLKLGRGDDFVPAEELNILGSRDSRISAAGFVLGRRTLVIGDDSGGVTAWSPVHAKGTTTGDGWTLARTHVYPRHDGAVSFVTASPRDRSFATGTRSGDVWLRHMTSERVLLKRSAEGAGEILAVRIAPRNDGILLVGSDQTHLWDFESSHPEVSATVLVGPVWYEGYDAPGFTWQSSSGSDDFEPKLSFVPLIFGTMKAAIYSMLFAVPIALLGAIYTSEFLHARMRGVIKPTIEMMAALPSVVLGFVAALVLAPLVQSWVFASIIVFFLIPTVVIAFAYFWQLLPTRLITRYSGTPQFVIASLLGVLSIVVAVRAAPGLEKFLFGGSIVAWLDGRTGTDMPIVFFLVFPLSILVLYAVQRKFLSSRLVEMINNWGRLRTGIYQIARVFVFIILGSVLSYFFSRFLIGLGWHPRETLLGTYVQRNTFVVGIAMGFAVIPIIYTIAEDALSAVPAHLKSASLGCGATRWQTATRIMIPTALSGIISAVMIGFGRAVGETMIVVMAAGNTPILDVNIFNGLRALSANIAVELPEAAKDSTLYRVLFLTALVLFFMTFILNTVAESVRLRFRRKAYEL